MANLEVIFSIVLALLIDTALCFSGGAPLESCATLSPSADEPPDGHGEDPLDIEVPYAFDLSALDDGNGSFVYIPGVTYPLPFASTMGLDILGVLFQGRVAADGVTPAGTFADTIDPLLQLAPCPGNTAVTQVNNDPKTVVVASWTAPPAGTGPVQIGFSVVLAQVLYWGDQRSSVIAEIATAAEVTTPSPVTATATAVVPTTTEEEDDGTGGMGMGGDPHFSIKLPSQKHLCYSVQGENGFIFNLISNKQVQMNALFVADSVREEVTWIGGLGVVIKDSPYKDSDMTTIRFNANKKTILIGNDVILMAQNIDRLTFKNGKLAVSEANRDYNCSCFGVQIELNDVGLNFSIHFIKNNHLDMMWDNVKYLSKDSHGIIGQFFRRGVDIDTTRKLLFIPDMEPVPVMRKQIWHFMEREKKEDLLCWVAMNPGYQGKRLIEGSYLDYVVDDLLSTKFSM